METGEGGKVGDLQTQRRGCKGLPELWVEGIVGGCGPDGALFWKPLSWLGTIRPRALALSVCSSNPFISTRRVESATVALCF
jgi:hypothetical protein